MILWRLRGYSDPEGESPRGEAVCEIEKVARGYRLSVRYANGPVAVEDFYVTASGAHQKARAVRNELIALGWSDVMKEIADRSP